MKHRLTIEQLKRFDPAMWLDIHEAAQYCQCSTKTIKRYSDGNDPRITCVIHPQHSFHLKVYSLIDLAMWKPEISANALKHRPDLAS